MKNNYFVWADLSTFDLEIAKEFYQQILDWKYYKADQDYFVAYAKDK